MKLEPWQILILILKHFFENLYKVKYTIEVKLVVEEVNMAEEVEDMVDDEIDVGVADGEVGETEDVDIEIDNKSVTAVVDMVVLFEDMVVDVKKVFVCVIVE